MRITFLAVSLFFSFTLFADHKMDPEAFRSVHHIVKNKDGNTLVYRRVENIKKKKKTLFKKLKRNLFFKYKNLRRSPYEITEIEGGDPNILTVELDSRDDRKGREIFIPQSLKYQVFQLVEGRRLRQDRGEAILYEVEGKKRFDLNIQDFPEGEYRVSLRIVSQKASEIRKKERLENLLSRKWRESRFFWRLWYRIRVWLRWFPRNFIHFGQIEFTKENAETATAVLTEREVFDGVFRVTFDMSESSSTIGEIQSYTVIVLRDGEEVQRFTNDPNQTTLFDIFFSERGTYIIRLEVTDGVDTDVIESREITPINLAPITEFTLTGPREGFPDIYSVDFTGSRTNDGREISFYGFTVTDQEGNIVEQNFFNAPRFDFQIKTRGDFRLFLSTTTAETGAFSFLEDAAVTRIDPSVPESFFAQNIFSFISESDPRDFIVVFENVIAESDFKQFNIRRTNLETGEVSLQVFDQYIPNGPFLNATLSVEVAGNYSFEVSIERNDGVISIPATIQQSFDFDLGEASLDVTLEPSTVAPRRFTVFSQGSPGNFGFFEEAVCNFISPNGDANFEIGILGDSLEVDLLQVGIWDIRCFGRTNLDLTATFNTTIEIVNQLPTASLEVVLINAATGEYELRGTGSDIDGIVESGEFTITSPLGVVQVIAGLGNIRSTLNQVGTYSISFVAIDNDGGRSEAQNQTVEILGNTLEANFSFEASETDLLGIDFDASSSQGAIVEYQWQFTTIERQNLTEAQTSFVFPLSNDYRVTLTVVDSAGQTDSITKLVSVSSQPGTFGFDPVTNGETRLAGFIIDTNAAMEDIGGDAVNIVPIVGATVSIEGTNVSVQTDATGAFDLRNLPVQDEYIIRIDSSTANPAADGSPYADFMEVIKALRSGKTLILGEPIYLPRIDTEAMITINPNEDQVLRSEKLDIELAIPAGVVRDEQGNLFTGELSISDVPEAQAPMALPLELAPGQLFTIQPTGVTFDEPISITAPNSNNYNEGQAMELFSLNPVTGEFESVGRGEVQGDRIVTTEGGIRSAAWGTFIFFAEVQLFSLSPNNDRLSGFVFDNRSQEICPKSCVGSAVSEHTGEFTDTFDLPSYRSLGTDRSLRFFYGSRQASPREMLLPTVTDFGTSLSIPRTYDFQPSIEVLDREGNTTEFSAENVVGRVTTGAANPERRLSANISSSRIPTGIHRAKALITASIAPDPTVQTAIIPVNCPSRNIQECLRRVRRFARPGRRALQEQPISWRNRAGSEFGMGWSLEGIDKVYTQFDFIDDDSNNALERVRVMLSRGNGSSLIFQSEEGVAIGSGDIRLLPPRGETSSMIWNSQTGLIRREFLNGDVHAFSRRGEIISITDRNGNITRFNYSNFGTFEETFLTLITDPKGLETSFEYDEVRGLLSKITDPTGRETRFVYDNRRHLVEVIYPDETSKKYGYNDRGLMTSKTSKRNFTTLIEYSDKDTVTKVTRPDNSVFEFESFLDDSFAVEGSASAPSGSQLEPANITGNPSNIATTVDGNGNRNQRVYNENNGNDFRLSTDNFLEPSSQGYDNNGNLISTRVINLARSRFTYDDNQNLSFAFYGTSVSTRLDTFTYEPNFNQIQLFENELGRIEFIYDNFGNNTEVRFQNRNGSTSDQEVVRRTFNEFGQVLTETDVRGKVTTFEYDTRGNLVRTIDPLSNTTQLFYDPAGNVVRIIDSKGLESHFQYDVMNRVTQVEDANGKLTLLSYNAEGLIERVVDSNNNTTSFEYEQRDRLSQMIDPRGKVESFTYDGNGNVVSRLTRNGDLITFEYDDVDNLIKKVTPEETTEYVYQAKTFLTEVNDNDRELNLVYENTGRLSGEFITNQAGRIQNNITYLTGSNDSIRRFSFQLPSETTNVDYSYNPLGDMLNYQYQRLGANGGILRVTNTFDGDRIENKNYFSSMNGLNQSNLETNMSYDDGGRLTSIGHQTISTSQILSNLSYGYDQNSNRTSVDVSRNIPGLRENLTFGYDQLNQLVSASSPILSDPLQTFEYDPLGNRLKVQGQAVDNIVGVGNRLEEDAQKRYSYDDNGNLIQEVEKATNKTRRYNFDSENQLLSIEESANGQDPFTTIAEYKYDGLGRRIEKIVGGERKIYFYFQDQITMEFSEAGLAAGIPRATYVYEPGIDNISAQIQEDGTSYFYLKDGLGSVTDLVDANGTVFQSYVYDAFGNTKVYNGSGTEIEASAGISNPFAYTGREFDSESGLYYYRARFYNPKNGRFLSEDPIGFAAGDYNLYRYVFNNPTNFTDPSGNIIPAVAACLGNPFCRIGAIGTVAGLAQGSGAFLSTLLFTNEGLDEAVNSFQGNFVGGFLAGAGFAIGSGTSSVLGLFADALTVADIVGAAEASDSIDFSEGRSCRAR